MIPEKGRNSSVALRRELEESNGIKAEWLLDIINGKGKRAAKTGFGYEKLENQVDSLNSPGGTRKRVGVQLRMKPSGRLKPRPVFDSLEFTDRRLEGYESPSDAWQAGVSRFYAGYDVLIEDLLRETDPLPVERGFETVVREEMTERGYELIDRMGADVKWAVMYRGDRIPDRPEKVLVPEKFIRLGSVLVQRYWGRDFPTQTFKSYAQQHDLVELDEETILAHAADGVAGVYMYVSGSTADENELTYEQIEGAVSNLGRFKTRTTTTIMNNITSLKGFYDRYSSEFSSWRNVIDTVEQTAKDFGFREIDTPAVERTRLYEVKSGEELLDQTYTFEDRGERRVTLTPEQTPTRARMIQERKDLNTPVKWVDTSKRWRYENVQKGRDREFFQTDIDIFDIESVAADAEVIACAATIYRRLGVEDQVEFLINDRNLLESLLEANGIQNTVEVMQVIDDKEKLSTREFTEALDDRGVNGAAADQVDQLTSIRGPIRDTVSELREKAPDDEKTVDAINRMADLADALESYGVASMCRLDLSIVRGLAYYTGLVFEAFDNKGELRALFGGGRYDDLVGLFGDREVPAVGFAFGYSTTRELLKREGKWPEEAVSTDVFVANVSESVRDEALDLATQLRQSNLVVETDLADRGLSAQFRYGDNINASWAVVVGERDLANDEVTLRDMESGDEEQVAVDEVVESLTKRIDE